MAKSFALDNAVGGGGPAQSTAPAGGTSTTLASTSSSSVPTMPEYGLMGGGSGVPEEPYVGAQGTPPASGVTQSGSVPTYPYSFPSPQMAPQSGAQGSNIPATAGGVYFDAGGSVPDDNGASQQQDPMSAILQKALGSVDQVLQYGYKQYGLTTGDQNQQGGVQEAANMPTVPAGQSETGIPPQRPAPGTLPPTSNPFGKRADAGQQGGIQNTDGDNDQEAA